MLLLPPLNNINRNRKHTSTAMTTMSNSKRSTVSVGAVVASVEVVAAVVVGVVWLGCDIPCRSRIAVFITYRR